MGIGLIVGIACLGLVIYRGMDHYRGNSGPIEGLTEDNFTMPSTRIWSAEPVLVEPETVWADNITSTSGSVRASFTVVS
jgi:hypothetical protein